MLSKKSVKALKELSKFIAKKPKRLSMSVGIANVNADTRVEKGVISLPECGLAACLGGSTVWMRYPKIALGLAREARTVLRGRGETSWPGVRALAEKILGIEGNESSRLFYLPGMNPWDGYWTMVWPPEFTNRYRAANTPEDRVKVAQDRIAFFIATGGTDNPGTIKTRKVKVKP